MSKEEIAKDLTVAFIDKMKDHPTTDTISEVYNAILQKIGEPTQGITLQTIKDQLDNQDKNAEGAVLLVPASVGVAIMFSSISFWVPDDKKCLFSILQFGIGLFLLGWAIWTNRKLSKTH